MLFWEAGGIIFKCKHMVVGFGGSNATERQQLFGFRVAA